jgi:hypothetical protein
MAMQIERRLREQLQDRRMHTGRASSVVVGATRRMSWEGISAARSTTPRGSVTGVRNGRRRE